MNSEIMMALRAGLAQHERASAQFGLQIASLCEKYGVEAAKQTCNLFVAETHAIQSSENAGLVTDKSVVTQSRTCGETIERPPVARRRSGLATHFTGDLPPHVVADSEFKNLPFLHPVNGLEEKLPLIYHVVGPRFLEAYKCVHRKLAMWRPMDNVFSRFWHSSFCNGLCALMNLANFIYIAAKADWNAANIGQDDPFEFKVISYSFTAFYTFELVMNIVVQGGTFLTCEDAEWNALDLIIVLLSLIEATLASVGSRSANPSFLRMLRFARVTKVLRMFAALRICKEIRIMIDALVGSISIFLTGVTLIGLMLALFAILFVQAYASHVEDARNDDNSNLVSTQSSIEIALLERYFGSVSASMMSFFMCATGGDDWKPYYDAAAHMGAVYKYLVLFFISFYQFSFYNVVTSVFCEKVSDLAKPTPEELLVDKYHQQFEDARELCLLLDAHLTACESTNTWQDMTAETFEKFINSPEVERYFEIRGLGYVSACRFFKMLCELHGTSHVDVSTFISATVKLDGAASRMDSHVMSVRQLYGMHILQTVEQQLHEKIGSLQEALTQFRTSDAPEDAMPSMLYEYAEQPPIDPNIPLAETENVRAMLLAIRSEMIELKSMQSQIQANQSQIQRDLQPGLSKKSSEGNRDFGITQLEKAHQLKSELEIQKCVREDLDIETQLARMSQKRESELKMILEDMTKRSEHMQQRGTSRNEPVDERGLDSVRGELV